MSKCDITSAHGNNNSYCGGCRIFFDKEGTLSYNTKKGRIFKLSGVIFDLDGTLLDSLHMWHDVDQRVLESFGMKPTNDLMKTLQPLTIKKSAEYLHTVLGVGSPPGDIIAEIQRLIEPHYYNSLPLKSGVPGFLELLKQQHVSMCIATATSKRLTEASLERTGVLSYFKTVVSCADSGTSKMQPDVYYQALDSIGTTLNGTLVFEDAYLAVKTLYEAGFSSVAVYDESCGDSWEQIKEIADIHINSFDCLMQGLA